MKRIETFSKETECIYKDEKYSVRDNGAIKRHSRLGKRARKDDNKWIFGKHNTINSFLELGRHSIHQIIATAFLGIQPSKNDVVVHLDSNKWNNKPENLRWVTRFENTILTPHNCEKIKELCGLEIESILKDIKQVYKIDLTEKFSWINNIEQEEASKALSHLKEIAYNDMYNNEVTLDDWLTYRNEIKNRVKNQNIHQTVIQSDTLNAIQVDWSTLSEFPCCPKDITDNPIVSYFKNLQKGNLFCTNRIYKSEVLDVELSEDEKVIFITTKSANPPKPWALAKIKYEKNKYYHYNLGSFFSEVGRNKYFALAQGKEWIGEDCIDDYC